MRRRPGQQLEDEKAGKSLDDGREAGETHNWQQLLFGSPQAREEREDRVPSSLSLQQDLLRMIALLEDEGKEGETKGQ